MAQPPDLLGDLLADVGEEGRVAERIDAAGEHEVLPDQDPQPVAQVVEGLDLVVAAAPDADHVVVGGRRRAQESLQLGGRDAPGEGVGRDPVAALREDGDAVDDEGERLAPDVGFAPQLERPEADLERPGLERPLTVDQLDLDPIERLPAQAVRPPQLGLGDVDRRLATGPPLSATGPTPAAADPPPAAAGPPVATEARTASVRPPGCSIRRIASSPAGRPGPAVPVSSTRISAAMRVRPPSIAWLKRTSARRATLQPSSLAPCQNPIFGSLGPQSQPK